MSITAETAKEHLNDKAVFCCRAEEGIVISPENLEDPGLFDDLVDSGLLSFPDDALTIGQVLGAKLTKTTDALIPITPGIIDAVQGGEEKVEAVEEVVEAAPVAAAPVAEVAPVAAAPVAQASAPAGVFRLQIGKGENINIEIPLSTFAGQAASTVAPAAAPAVEAKAVEVKADAPVAAAKEEKTGAAKFIRSLHTKHYKIDEVVFGEKTEIQGTTLVLSVI